MFNQTAIRSSLKNLQSATQMREGEKSLLRNSSNPLRVNQNAFWQGAALLSSATTVNTADS